MVASRSSAFRINTQAGSRACDEALLWCLFKNEGRNALARLVRTTLPTCGKLEACARLPLNSNCVLSSRAHELQLDVIIFSAAISACGKGSLWLSALALLASMTKQQLLPNQARPGPAQLQPSRSLHAACGCAQVTYGALAAACEKAATWRAAIAILQHALQQDQTGTASHNQGPA